MRRRSHRASLCFLPGNPDPPAHNGVGLHLLLIWTSPLLSSIGERLLCYRISATEPPREASWLDLIFIRIACLYCHIPSPSHTLWWTQFSAGVATALTAWFFTLQQSRTGWPVISAFTIPDPLWLTCSLRAFSLWLPDTLHCTLTFSTLRITGSLEGCQKSKQILFILGTGTSVFMIKDICSPTQPRRAAAASCCARRASTRYRSVQDNYF